MWHFGSACNKPIWKRRGILSADWQVNNFPAFASCYQKSHKDSGWSRKLYSGLVIGAPKESYVIDLLADRKKETPLLQPGLLSTARSFQKQFVDRRDKLMPHNVDELHRLLAEVMIRNRRSTVGLALTRRIVKTHFVTLNDSERALYNDVSRFIRQQLSAPSDVMRNANGTISPVQGRNLVRVYLDEVFFIYATRW
jgi:hypothetical protein